MWHALHEAGDIDRGWCQHWLAVIRNFLSDKGLLSWQNESFVVGVLDDRGRFVPGKAAKWKAGEELMAMMGQAEAVEQAAEVRVVEREEEEGILYRCIKPDQDCKPQVGGEKTTLYGHKAVSQPLPTPNPRQSESFLDVLGGLGIWISLQKPRFSGFSMGDLRMAA